MPRKSAFRVLQRMDEGAYSHLALNSELERGGLEPRDRGLATQLVYATLTWQRSLDTIINGCLSRGANIDENTRLILRLGVVQLVFLDRIPEHAAVSESVDLAQEFAKTSAGLVNAVLRRIARERPPYWNDEDRTNKPMRYLANRWSLPNWLANRMVQQMGIDEAEEWMKVINTAPPFWLRARNAVPDGAEPHASGAFRTEQLGPYMDGLRAGDWVVQDLAAQLVGLWCDVKTGQTAWDACAGLGGKALHLADLGADVTASDPNASKLELLSEADISSELGASAGAREERNFSIIEGRAQDVSPDLGEFDIVLLDAPCTSLGVIRRHPETRWTRKEHDITTLAAIQKELLETVAKHVKMGGHLVYSVCTFTREETSKQIENFLQAHPEFEVDPPENSKFDWTEYRQGPYLVLNPARHDSDAFFAARLRRTS